MKKILTLLVAMLMLSASLAVGAEEPKLYKDGPVIALSYIKIKNGKYDDYLKFLDTDYKSLMEAYKKAGLITSFAVYNAYAKTPSEPDLILATTYPNMAALDKTDAFESVSIKTLGSNASQDKAAIDRDSLRTVLGGELIREVILK